MSARNPLTSERLRDRIKVWKHRTSARVGETPGRWQYAGPFREGGPGKETGGSRQPKSCSQRAITHIGSINETFSPLSTLIKSWRRIKTACSCVGKATRQTVTAAWSQGGSKRARASSFQNTTPSLRCSKPARANGKPPSHPLGEGGSTPPARSISFTRIPGLEVC